MRLAFVFAAVSLAQAQVFDAGISASRIERFEPGSDRTRFGALEFVGGLSLSAESGHFGAVSAIRFRDAGAHFLAITDTGFWLTGTIDRDASGVPVGASDFRMSEIEGEDGKPLEEKYLADAESLALDNGIATIGFERYHRITEFAFSGDMPGGAERNLDFIVPARELRENRGFECLTVSDPASPLAGARIAITEKSLDKHGNMFGAILEGPLRGQLTVQKSGAFDITDCDFLPGGDLVLLERRYSMATGPGMQIRRIPAASIRPGAVLDGEVLITADLSYQIDNMEGLDVWQATDGSAHLSIVSDDNHSLLQRNLYLEFKLATDN